MQPNVPTVKTRFKPNESSYWCNLLISAPLMFALWLGGLSSLAGQPLLSDVDGAFGIKLGLQIELKSRPVQKTASGFVYRISPPRTNSSFEEYWVEVTPTSKLVAAVTARVAKMDAPQNKDACKVIKELLKQKYGEPTSELAVASMTRWGTGSRSVTLLEIDGALRANVRYEDKDICRKGALEFEALEAERVREKVKKADGSAL